MISASNFYRNDLFYKNILSKKQKAYKFNNTEQFKQK